MCEIKYSLSPYDTVHWAEWDDSDECVLFLQKSGMTTIVSTLSLVILDILTRQPSSEASLFSQVSKHVDESVDERTLASAIQSNLTQLQQIGAIENVSSFLSFK
jgi:PqqD family protein of HPr-rel-A system